MSSHRWDLHLKYASSHLKQNNGHIFISAENLNSEEIHVVIMNNGKTCALKLARPHALSRCSTLGTIRCLTTGLSAVTRQEDLSLVDAAVMLRCAAN